MATEYFTLNTGAKIPAVGFGTWKAAPGDAGKAVEAALEAGYRHIVSPPIPREWNERGTQTRSEKEWEGERKKKQE